MISSPRLVSVPIPYLPMANAIAPKAPIGAAYMTMRITWKKALPTRSMPRTIGLPASPIKCSAIANTTEKNRTCRTSPSANAPTTLSGKMWKMGSYQCDDSPCDTRNHGAEDHRCYDHLDQVDE